MPSYKNPQCTAHAWIIKSEVGHGIGAKFGGRDSEIELSGCDAKATESVEHALYYGLRLIKSH